MAENQTQPTDADVDEFLDAVPNERRRAEGHAVRRLMERVTGERPVMWGRRWWAWGSATEATPTARARPAAPR